MRIPIAPAHTEIEVKRSRFIAIAEPVTNTEEMPMSMTVMVLEKRKVVFNALFR